MSKASSTITNSRESYANSQRVLLELYQSEKRAVQELEELRQSIRDQESLLEAVHEFLRGAVAQEKEATNGDSDE